MSFFAPHRSSHFHRPGLTCLFILTSWLLATTAFAAPTVSINDVAKNEGDSGTENFDFQLTLSGPSAMDVTIAYATSSGTATVVNHDYVPVSATATIQAGDLSTKVRVLVVGDKTLESDETFFVNLAAATNASVLDGVGMGTILNDDGVPKITIDDVTHHEGDVGTTPFVFTVSLDNPTDQDVTMEYETVSGTATAANNDYVPASGTATIPAKFLSTTITVLVNGDLTKESDERFFVRLSNPMNASLDDAEGVGKIENDDGKPKMSIDDVSLAEGDAGKTAFDFTVSLTHSSTQEITVDFKTVDGSAQLVNGDYQSTSGTATIPPKTLSIVITVPVNGDVTPELDETFTLKLSHASGAMLTSEREGVGTIENDDGPTAVGDQLVTEFALGVVAPNPSRGMTRIDFALPRASRIRLTVLDVQGREVAVLAEGLFEPGRHQGTWNARIAGRAAPAGVYFARYQTPGQNFVRRIVLVR